MTYYPGRRLKFKRMLSIDGLTTCWYCRAVIDASRATVDHAVPVSKGGVDRWVNYRLSCLRCNLAKGNTMPGGRGSHA